MTRLTNRATGHSVEVSDDASSEFWSAAGYRADKAEAKKASAKKAAAKKSSAKKASAKKSA